MRVASVDASSRAPSGALVQPAARPKADTPQAETPASVLSVGARLHLAAHKACVESMSQRAQRLECLREQVAADDYHVDCTQLAELVLQDIVGTR